MALWERTQRPGRVLTLPVTAYLASGPSSSLPWPVPSFVDETLSHTSVLPMNGSKPGTRILELLCLQKQLLLKGKMKASERLLEFLILYFQQLLRTFKAWVLFDVWGNMFLSRRGLGPTSSSALQWGKSGNTKTNLKNKKPTLLPKWVKEVNENNLKLKQTNTKKTKFRSVKYRNVWLTHHCWIA